MQIQGAFGNGLTQLVAEQLRTDFNTFCVKFEEKALKSAIFINHNYKKKKQDFNTKCVKL
jgi:hypothetical protein